MDLSIITVTYQSKESIDTCILSVVTSIFNSSYEHIIVDNGSTDGTVELIEDGYLGYVKLIKNKNNLGFAAANNIALKEAKGRYILFLNPDMRLYQGRLDDLLKVAESRKDIGILSCKLLSHFERPHEVLKPSRYPSLFPYLPAFLRIKPFFCSVNPHFFYPVFDDHAEQEVEMVRGAFMMIRKGLLDEIGYAFDPRYYILFEDIDLCKEMKKRGYKIWYTPRISCIDYFGLSFSKQTEAWKYCQMVKSFKTYIRKWHSPLHLLWVNAAAPIGFLLRIPEWGLKNSLKALKTSLRSP